MSIRTCVSEKYVRVCRAVAHETKTPLVDHYERWSRRLSEGGDPGDWTTDQCHPNPRGHREIADALLPVVLEVLRKEKSERDGTFSRRSNGVSRGRSRCDGPGAWGGLWRASPCCRRGSSWGTCEFGKAVFRPSEDWLSARC